MIATFMRVGDCPNWDEALALARERACCGGNPARPNRGDRQCRCQKAAPCDLCLFLNSDRPPEMKITRNLGAEGHVIPKETPGVPDEDAPSKWAKQEGYFDESLCHGSNNIKRLAATMIHEAAHLCVSITYERAADALGRRDKQTELCHAYGLEYMCGFNPAIPKGTPCFIITR